jgi:PAS domain S-box-containing protein
MNNSFLFESKLKNIFAQSEKKNLSYEEILEKYSKFDEDLLSEKNEKEIIHNSFYNWIKNELNDHSSFGLIAFDFTNNVACINKKCSEILNIEQSLNTSFETVKNLLNLVEKKSDFFILLKNARNQKQKIIGDFKLKFFDEPVSKWINIEGRYDFDENDQPISFFCSLIDISEKRQNDKFQKLINSVVSDAKHAIIITEAEPLSEPGPRIVYVNEAYTQLTGYTYEEAIGHSPRFMQGSETDEESLKELRQSLLKWEACKAELINYKKNGEKFWVELDIKPIKKSDGYVTHWVSVQKDITAVKLAELQLIESESRYKTLINDSLELIQSVGVNGEILFVNNIWKKTLGYSDEEIETMNIFDVIADESKPQCLAEYEMIMRGEFIYDAKPVFKTKNGKKVYLEGNSVPRITNEEVLGTQGFFKNISNEVIAENNKQRLELSIKQLQSFANVGEFSYDFISDECICSDQVSNIFGVENGDIRTLEEWLARIHPNDKEDVEVTFFSNLREKAIFEKEFRVLNKQNSNVVWVRYRGEFEYDKKDNPIRFHGTVKDISVQKLSDKKILDAKNQIKFIFNSLEEVFFKLDVTNQKIIEVSDNCEFVFGFTKDDFFNDYYLPFKIVHPDDMQMFEKDRVILNEGRSVLNEYRIIDINGEIKWIESKSSPVLDDNSELISLDLIARDISNRKNSELLLKNALTQLEDYKKAIDESAIVSITDAKGVIIYVNNKFTEISQFPEEECLWKKHNIINSNYHPKEFFDDMWDTITKGLIWKGEVCNKAKDGSLYWVDSTIIPFLKDDKPCQYISIRYDITEKVKMAEEIQKQKSFYEIILNEIPADIVVFDKNHKYLFINPNGVKDEELRNFLIGKDDYDYCKLKNKDISIADERRKLFLKAIESKVGFTFEEAIVDISNNTSYKLRKFYPVFDANNQCEFVIGFGMDITELKEQELIIEDSLKEKETLLGEIHHRVKNNLAVIDGLLELKKFYEKDTTTIETLGEVQMRIKIIALVHEKLYQTVQFSNINLSDYLKELTNYYKQIFNKTDGDQVSFKINVDNVNLDISKSITFGLLLNEFISNSLKYGIINHRVAVNISLVANDDVFILNYKDSGNGLPDSVKKGEQKGFGYKLINTFIKQLKGQIVYVESLHFEVEIRFKLK